jgi:GTP diphosphokinase / guanosine-3',5'-bis(diphosphate) 3'-diphosphatase
MESGFLFHLAFFRNPSYNQNMSQLDDLIAHIKYPSEEKIKLITRAFKYAERVHKGQTRYSGEPYFNHLVETAKILAELGMGRRSISAGLLHDTLEDAGISSAELKKEFGKEITFLVEGVTKLGTIRYQGQERHVESLRKFFVAMSKDLRVLVIKLADRLHNMRTLEHVPQEKRMRIALETMEIYVPLAYRLGIRKIKRELEDLSFKYINPEEYSKTQLAVSERIKAQEKESEKFRRSLLKSLAKSGITHVVADHRVKSIYSIYKKTQFKKIDISKVYDINALRVHVDSIDDCYRVLGVIHSLWRPLPGRIKDYIAFPKPNGYQSLHTTVFSGDGSILEIQIRTHEMHENAEFGIASHIAYKERKSTVKDPQYSWFKQFFPPPPKNPVYKNVERPHVIPTWIKRLVDIQSYVSMPTEFYENLKSDFFQHRMFIFNPSGEVIDLPVDSTPIDFAYEMAIELGHHLSGSKVNGKLVPIDTPLKNGDLVEIITKKTSKPNIKWLESCKTSLAKKHIREALSLETPPGEETKR